MNPRLEFIYLICPKKFHEKHLPPKFAAEPRRDWIEAIHQKLLSTQGHLGNKPLLNIFKNLFGN